MEEGSMSIREASKNWDQPNWSQLTGLRGASQVALVVKNPPANAGDIRDTGSIPGMGRAPGGGHGNPLQYSWLKNPTDRGAWLRVKLNWSDLACMHSWQHRDGDISLRTRNKILPTTWMSRKWLCPTASETKIPGDLLTQWCLCWTSDC